MAVAHEPRNLARDARHGRAREAVLAAGQRIGADFDDQALFVRSPMFAGSFYIGL